MPTAFVGGIALILENRFYVSAPRQGADCYFKADLLRRARVTPFALNWGLA